MTPAFLDHVASTVRRALAERDRGRPGLRAGRRRGRRRSARRLAGLDGIDVRPLHGRLPAPVQDLALATGPRRRVVVSTAVAESSLTVPGVRLVVDAGLSREPRTDHRRGLAGLVTVGVSRASAEQRAGRAGREGPGAVYRCWSAHDHARLVAHPEPEILTADLTAFALELACWGSPDGVGLALLDRPPAAAMAVAQATLAALGAVDADGHPTARGRAVSAVPADPRLARGLLDGAALVGRTPRGRGGRPALRRRARPGRGPGRGAACPAPRGTAVRTVAGPGGQAAGSGPARSCARSTSATTWPSGSSWPSPIPTASPGCVPAGRRT